MKTAPEQLIWASGPYWRCSKKAGMAENQSEITEEMGKRHAEKNDGYKIFPTVPFVLFAGGKGLCRGKEGGANPVMTRICREKSGLFLSEDSILSFYTMLTA